MIRSSSVPRDLMAAAATAVLALTVGLSAAFPAQADDGDTGQGCGVGIVCELLPGEQKTPPGTPGTGKPVEPPSASDTPTPPPAAPAPEPTVPAVPVAPAPAPVQTVAPAPTISAVEETPTPEATTSAASPSAASASPSAESNWDTPVTKSAKATQAAAVSRNGGSGLFGSPGLLPVMAGVLLVGVAGLAFAWWARNRLSSH
jgi:outer membrane biosynthesis protein TonB